MYYKYSRGCRIPVDLDGMYPGRTCFIAGGAPSLLNEDLSKLNQPGISLMSMNNTPSVLPTGCVDFWVGLDKPLCYAPRILMDPKIQKFAIIAKKGFPFPYNGKDYTLQQMPNMYFIGTVADDDPNVVRRFTYKTLLKPERDFVWWKNTFWVALQIAYRFGFRKVYLIGCAFNLTPDKQYSYDYKLSDYQQQYNQKLYNQTVASLRECKSHFDDVGFQVISATPDSKLNEFYPSVSYDEAIKDALGDYPVSYDLSTCVHSTFFTDKKESR
jgi:hypothetical protein